MPKNPRVGLTILILYIMKNFNYVIATVLMFSLFGCEKEGVVNDVLTEKEPTEIIDPSTYFSYNVNDIEEVIRLANENYTGDTNSSNRAGDPTFEIDYRGIYIDIVNPNNPIHGGICLRPANVCGIVITADKNINVQGNTTIYTDSDIIKMYPDNPVRVSYNKITVTMGPTTEYPDALSSFVFE